MKYAFLILYTLLIAGNVWLALDVERKTAARLLDVFLALFFLYEAYEECKKIKRNNNGKLL